ncbi:Lar family restriction alleviation protein [Marinobacter sp. Hex_13]|uniref:Lar family restriction alleviation protein n=1 Tax=Marinobacter sp. Hex_13 TaxID=1795866 RepID=UPI000791AFD4|nr:Lar family restriction alleviation protein [Marinobacter sp. Hex_13]KXJ45843.1 MAG: hypothetical protein AXW11_12185 [Marinobacter sp. Hex_13]
MDKLKPCPFCGSEAAEPVFIGNDNTRRRKVTIRCKAPGCTQGVTVGALRFSHEWCHAEAVKKWNSRAESDELTAAKARIAELETAAADAYKAIKNDPAVTDTVWFSDIETLCDRLFRALGEDRAAALLEKK